MADDRLVEQLERFRDQQRAARAARVARWAEPERAEPERAGAERDGDRPDESALSGQPEEPEDRGVRQSARHAAPAAPGQWGDRVRTGVRGVGQTLISLGVVILLLVAYELWITDLFNHQKQGQLQNQLAQEWGRGEDPTIGMPGEPGVKVRKIPLGQGIALIRVPALGLDYVRAVVEGTDEASLAEGPGHYVQTALPGQVGNFSIAGHRVGKGSPFLDLDRLKAGDAIVIETRQNFYIYRVLGDRRTGDPTVPGRDGIPGQEIVSPSNTEVIRPVPDRPGMAPVRRFLTLTTCHPRFSARQRMIIHAELAGPVWPKSRGLPPVLRG
ncbi:MAG TPA: class E sortase [Mycobacteriales bacterium]|nr:class E sortase [Mycobacteriales bacterium]